jgi:hypothetical protein
MTRPFLLTASVMPRSLHHRMQSRKCSAMVSGDCEPELEAAGLGTKSLVAIDCTLNGSGSVSVRGSGRLMFG